MDPGRSFVKGNVRFDGMRRHLSLAAASAVLALAVAGFLGGPGAAPAAPGHDVERAVTSPLVELQAAPAAAPRIDTAAAAPLAVLLTAAAVAVVTAGYLVRDRRRRSLAAVAVGSVSLRGPTRLAAL